MPTPAQTEGTVGHEAAGRRGRTPGAQRKRNDAPAEECARYRGAGTAPLVYFAAITLVFALAAEAWRKRLGFCATPL